MSRAGSWTWSCVRVHSGGMDFEGMKGLWGVAEARTWESPGENIREGTVSEAVEGPGMKGS